MVRLRRGSMADMGALQPVDGFSTRSNCRPPPSLNRSEPCRGFHGAIHTASTMIFHSRWPVPAVFAIPLTAIGARFDLYRYDGGIRHSDELAAQGKELPQEGMILWATVENFAGFNVQNPNDHLGQTNACSTNRCRRDRNQVQATMEALRCLFRPVNQTAVPGSFPEAEYLNETINLYAVALRTNKALKFDPATEKSLMCRMPTNTWPNLSGRLDPESI